MPSRYQPALFGGLFIGVLSALPIINIANCCCCLWVVLGGIIAAYLAQNDSPTAITVGDGAVAGLMAGVVGAIVNALLALPLRLLVGPFQSRMAERILENAGDVPESLRDLMQPGQMGDAGLVLGTIFSFFLMLVVCIIFATIGGMIGAALFNRTKPSLVQPPPPGPVE